VKTRFLAIGQYELRQGLVVGTRFKSGGDQVAEVTELVK
jgi:hypothetical protein